jgi:hypothetical protein
MLREIASRVIHWCDTSNAAAHLVNDPDWRNGRHSNGPLSHTTIGTFLPVAYI